MKLRLVKAASWEEIEAVADKFAKCIGLNKPNWLRARQTWQTYSTTDDVIYFISHPVGVTDPQGYLRLLRVSGFPSSFPNPGYIADFISSSDYLYPRLAQDLLPNARIFAKVFGGDSDIWANNWPVVRLAFPALERYPYHNSGAHESDWRLVIA
jgi:hypothetical protein